MSFKVKLVIENAMKDPYTIEQTCKAINRFLTKSPAPQKQEAPQQPEPPIQPIDSNERKPFVIPMINEVEQPIEINEMNLLFEPFPFDYNIFDFN